MTKGRGFAPVVASVADQCVLLGMFIVTTAPERAKAKCRELMESRFGGTGADVPASSPASAPATAPAAQARAAPASTAARPKDADAIDAAIDAQFIAWARNWFTDRYARGSAHVAQAQCQAKECLASGRFAFTRAGAPYQATFDASLSTDGTASYAVTRLCYDDPSSGLSDCAR